MDIVKSIRDILSGEIFAKFFTKKNLWMIFWIFIMSLFYIVSHFYGIYIYREIDKTEKEINNLRAENVEIQSQLLKKTNRRENVLLLLDAKGSTIKEPQCPPYKIVYRKKKTKKGLFANGKD